MSTKISIHITSALKDELSYVKSCLSRAEFYRHFKYTVLLPPGVNLGDTWSSKVARLTREDWVRNKPGFQRTRGNLLRLWHSRRKDISNFFTSWPYPTIKHVTVRLTAYGPGGSYFPPHTIIVRMKRPSIRKNHLETIIHEIVHNSIQKLVVEKYHLTHVQKEGLVDSVFLNSSLKSIFPGYRIQLRSRMPTKKILQKIHWVTTKL